MTTALNILDYAMSRLEIFIKFLFQQYGESRSYYAISILENIIEGSEC